MTEAVDRPKSLFETDDPMSVSVATFTEPDDVLKRPGLSVAAKREILAAWASDAHAVPNQPAMRQLDSGAIVNVDAVLGALRALDASQRTVRPGPRGRGSPSRSRLALAARWRLRKRDDDDDDPPPCPAAALAPGLERELRRRRDAGWSVAAA